ncbi:hypothetical protein PISL3812_02579 [Talaromyces islandicus]|uniref:Peroxin 20 n=1 Tax=Talaromyces islandicus TaxID=28573 RepID=A0A0U1LQB7_TALIS|nr:hypothetical protein PISL3812_02579 [Talaromyces islandicus]
MADALCGPSNALQNFQKHTAVDRTLQQDRLINRQSPGQQGFRSQNLNANVLDSEFQAFENNFAGNAPMLEQPGAFNAPVHAPSHPAFAADASDWASDFQNLRLSGPSQNIHQQQLRQGPAPNAVHSNGWQHEFSRHQQQNSQNPMAQSTPMANFQTPFQPSYHMNTGIMGQFPTNQGPVQANLNHAKEPAAFDESAFEAAFEHVQAEMDQQQTTAEQAQSTGLDETQIDSECTDLEVDDQIRIGSDLITNNTDTNDQEQKQDPDELARTAGNLLESLSHENSKKFQESNFLALMRRIRDREVHIEGDEFRESSQPLHPGGRSYPGTFDARKTRVDEDRPTADPQHRIGLGEQKDAKNREGPITLPFVRPSVGKPCYKGAAIAPKHGTVSPLNCTYDFWTIPV